MSNYRPKDWKNPYKNYCSQDSLLLSEVYNEGADAMVEGQKKEGWRVNGDSVIPASGGFPEIHVPGGMKGYLVFIPDES